MMSNETQSKLNDELREFAEYSPVQIVKPVKEDVLKAIQPHFSALLEQHEDIQSLLDEVGLPVITDISRNYQPKRISWSIVRTQVEADEQLAELSQDAYQSIRDELKIDYHWIFLVPSKPLKIYTSEPLMEGMGDFKDDGMPKCWILDRFS